jgi:ABC-2 type transport system permease protein
MRQTLLIAKRALGTLFRSPLAYVVLTLFLLCNGFFFFSICYKNVYSMETMTARVNVPVLAYREFWQIAGWLLLFMAPIISMGSIAGEKSRGTIELLLTSPLRFSHIIVGKYLALVVFLVAMVVPTAAYFAFLRAYGGLGWGEIVSGILAAFLLGAAAMSLGILISALTKNQIIAAFGTFAGVLIFWFVDAAGNSFPSFWRNIIRYLSLHVHFSNLMTGRVGLNDVVYFVSFCIFFLFMAHLSIQILWSKGKWN